MPEEIGNYRLLTVKHLSDQRLIIGGPGIGMVAVEIAKAVGLIGNRFKLWGD